MASRQTSLHDVLRYLARLAPGGLKRVVGGSIDTGRKALLPEKLTQLTTAVEGGLGFRVRVRQMRLDLEALQMRIVALCLGQARECTVEEHLHYVPTCLT